MTVLRRLCCEDASCVVVIHTTAATALRMKETSRQRHSLRSDISRRQLSVCIQAEEQLVSKQECVKVCHCFPLYASSDPGLPHSDIKMCMP